MHGHVSKCMDGRYANAAARAESGRISGNNVLVMRLFSEFGEKEWVCRVTEFDL